VTRPAIRKVKALYLSPKRPVGRRLSRQPTLEPWADRDAGGQATCPQNLAPPLRVAAPAQATAQRTALFRGWESPRQTWEFVDSLLLREVLPRTGQDADLQAFANIAAISRAVATVTRRCSVVLCQATKIPDFRGFPIR